MIKQKQKNNVKFFFNKFGFIACAIFSLFFSLNSVCASSSNLQLSAGDVMLTQIIHARISQALSAGDNEIINETLKSPRFDVNFQSGWGYTILMRAAIEGNVEITEKLLQFENIDVNIQRRNQFMANGFTAIMWAARYNHPDIVKILLLVDGIDPTLTDENGFTALMWAKELDHTEVEEVLLEAGIAY